MTTSRRLVLLVGTSLVALSAMIPVSTQGTTASVNVAADYTVMPKGPSWTRPAPTTWSSRANVRWQARFGGDARYMA